ncbi:DegT/DnrJ/EryC1/StrS family aminotransferase [Gillisia sp. Hel_I_29]|uniref:DegT/DnrJ/EryC1/StrS family aminotransferase n=1 Tax=Gillisia sp. Hel_I_29 TaxID=1249975 RepID=UPI000552258D|nr:DegT/DnrJ/EryC1/StrS family aminotransferase [Gillisia sp. Hel_I_29]
MIPVTKTFLPPREEYQSKLKVIWESNQLTNGGELLFQLQSELKGYLNIENVILTTNGTLPIQIALKILAKKGEVITTPFSYVATTSSIVWENCIPVFVDIDPEYWTIDENKIEAAITKNTTAILATHVFGNPCNIDKISAIARKFNLNVIYDAAHCFGVKYQGDSIFNFGDVCTCSFHATKLFHTGEGGALFSRNDQLYKQLFYSHNFGHDGALNYHGLGINAKMSELQAAMGLSVLPYVGQLIAIRKVLVDKYNDSLFFHRIRPIKLREHTEWNYSYYPIVFENEEKLIEAEKLLNENEIYPRRYFYPSLNTLSYVTYKEMKISEEISKTILCLPLYVSLELTEVVKISNLINSVI